jgi:hypothetical protein
LPQSPGERTTSVNADVADRAYVLNFPSLKAFFKSSQMDPMPEAAGIFPELAAPVPFKLVTLLSVPWY